MRTTLYINTPFTEQEYAAIAKAASADGRSKGQQMRFLALQALGFTASPPSKRTTKKGAVKP
jgi:hypothetical protein